MQAQPTAKRRQMILVLGMHRSGTSAVTGTLAHLGAELGGHAVPAAADNPKGFFEHADIFALHQELLQGLKSDWDDTTALPADWITTPEAYKAAARIREILRRDFAESRLAVIKDPRLCRFVPLWRAPLADEGFLLKIVLVVREGTEVVASLVKRDALRPEEAAGVWLRHELEAEAATRGDPRVVVPYAAVLHDWRGEARRISSALGLEWPRSLNDAGTDIDRFLDAGLRHHHHGLDKPLDQGLVTSPIADWLETVHAALTRSDGIASDRMDEIAQTLSRMDRDSKIYTAPLQRLRQKCQRLLRDLEWQCGQTEAMVKDKARLEQEVAHWRPEAEKVWENHEWLRAQVEKLESAAGQSGEHLADLRQSLADDFRLERDAVASQVTRELADLREGLAEEFRQLRDEAEKHREAERALGEHWRAELDAQRDRLSRDLQALREEASLTHIECETLRKAVLESQSRLDALQLRMQLLHARRLSLRERMAGRLLGNETR